MADKSELPPPTHMQSELDEASQPGSSQELQFLTFTDISQATARETKQKVRSHAQHQVQRSLGRKRLGKKPPAVVLDISSLSQAEASSSAGPGLLSQSLSVVPHPLGLGAGRSNPFGQYPIDMDVRAHELFDHLHGRSCPMFRTLSKIGFFRSVLDEAAFRQILCTSSSHMSSLRKERENTEAIVLSTEAIRSINKRIVDPVLGLSDGVIVAVLAFACHAVMFHDAQGALTHFNGLEEIIRRRGGLNTFRSNQVLRTVIFWIDVNVAFYYDRAPRFPIPDDILPRINPETLISIPSLILQKACSSNLMISTIADVLVLNQIMTIELTTRDLWDDGVFAGVYIVPLLSKLLSIRHNDNELNGASAREESCRIGTILYLAGIRRRFGVELVSDIQISHLRLAIIAHDGANDEETISLLLWLLVIGGVQSFMHEHHDWFVSTVVTLVIQWQYRTWDQVMAAVRKILWVDGILEVECSRFQEEVSSKSWNSHHYILS